MRASMIVLLMLMASSANAHELHYSTTEGRAILIEISYPDHGALSGAPYEIRAAGETAPVQMGWTDAHGRIAFAPLSAGTYHVSVFSEGGHGVNVSVEVDENLAVTASTRAPIERHLKILVGIGVLLGIFGLLMLFYRRKPV